MNHLFQLPGQDYGYIRDNSSMYLDSYRLPVAIVVADGQGDLLLCNQPALDLFCVENFRELTFNKRLYALNCQLLSRLINELNVNGDFSNKPVSIGLYKNSQLTTTGIICSAVRLKGNDYKWLYVFMFYKTNSAN